MLCTHYPVPIIVFNKKRKCIKMILSPTQALSTVRSPVLFIFLSQLLLQTTLALLHWLAILPMHHSLNDKGCCTQKLIRSYPFCRGDSILQRTNVSSKTGFSLQQWFSQGTQLVWVPETTTENHCLKPPSVNEYIKCRIFI